MGIRTTNLLIGNTDGGRADQFLRTDGAGNLSWADVATEGDGFASGTAMIFRNASAPVGWTRSSAHNNKALRVVSGSGGGSGGNVAFTSAFQSSRSVSVTLAKGNLTTASTTASGNVALSGLSTGSTRASGTISGSVSVANRTLSSNQIPRHTHNVSLTHRHAFNAARENSDTQSGDNDRECWNEDRNTSNAVAAGGSSAYGNSAAHNHGANFSGSFSGANHTHNVAGTARFSGNAHSHNINGAPTGSGSTNIAVQYIDVIVGVKN